MVARAEAALAQLSVCFGSWMHEEIGLLDAARARVHNEGLNGESGDSLNIQAHEVKGLAATFGYPLVTLVTHIAGSLCKLIEDPATRKGAPMFLVDAHIDAMTAALRDNVRELDHPVSRALIHELQTQVRGAI